MKKCHWLLTIGLVLLVVAPAVAQQASLGLYFDAAGTQTTKVFIYGTEQIHTTYLIAFVENVVGGGACKLEMDPEIVLLEELFPAGVQTGESLLTGREIGLTNPIPGYSGQPVQLARLRLFTDAGVTANGTLTIAPFAPNYEFVTLSDPEGMLFPATGLTSTLTMVVPTDVNSWSQVKGLYR